MSTRSSLRLLSRRWWKQWYLRRLHRHRSRQWLTQSARLPPYTSNGPMAASCSSGQMPSRRFPFCTVDYQWSCGGNMHPSHARAYTNATHKASVLMPINKTEALDFQLTWQSREIRHDAEEIRCVEQASKQFAAAESDDVRLQREAHVPAGQIMPDGFARVFSSITSDVTSCITAFSA